MRQSHLNNFSPKVISKFSDICTIAKYRRCYPRNLDVLARRVADAFQDCADDHETILAQGDS
jgi:hypothetical protein